MGRFDDSSLQEWTTQSQNPAAPAGQQAAATAAGGYESGDDRFANSSLGQWVSESGYVGAAQSWYTGANPDGTGNGWDTRFTEEFISGQEQAAQEGRLGTYFEQPNATGVVTWDHTSSDGTNDFKFGDIYERGKLAGNLYDQFDRQTADLMMADWLFSGEQKAEIFSDGDVKWRLRTEVADKRESNNIEIPKALSAAEFNEDVEAREEALTEGAGDELIVAGGATGTAMLVGGGLAATGVGLLPGAIIAGGAGIAGGIASWMNKDALTEQAARAYEITAMSTRENGQAAGVATGIQQWAGFGMKTISPLSNLAQGLTDVGMGEVGDGTSEFYRTDAAGDRQVPTWVKVADVAGSVGDAALQFSNPIGLTLYTTSMTGVVGGQVAELALTGGETFDYTQGGFDNIFTDDDGNFDASAAAAGIGKIGIDAVQLGMARGLAGKVQSARTQAGVDEVALARDGFFSGFGQRLYGGGRGADRPVVGGYRYTLDDAGQAVSRRASLSLLAPSEQLTALSARVLALRTTARSKGAASADDLYRAATALATGERKVTTALVNGMGEGYEEAVQAVLEPHSHGTSASMEDIANQALYGFAGGLGMGVGLALRSPSADQKMFAQAAVAYHLRTGGASLTKSEWDKFDEPTKRSMAAMGNLERATMKSATEKLVAEQAVELNAGFVGANKLIDAIETQRTADLAASTPRTDGAYVITQMEQAPQVDAAGNLLPGSMPSDAVGASAKQIWVLLGDHLRGIDVQIGSMQREIAEVEALIAADPANAELTERSAAIMANLERAALSADWGTRILADIDRRIDRMYADTATEASVQAEIEAANEMLRDIFNERFQGAGPIPAEEARAMARAVSLRFTRDPQDQTGSYPMLVPQISLALTLSNSDNHLQINHAILAAIRGDFDGDKLRQINQVILDEEEWISVRSGAAYLGAGTSVNVPPMKFENYLIEQLAAAITSSNVTLGNYATGTLVGIGDAIRNRFSGVIETRILDSVLDEFFSHVHAGDKDARAVLLDGLASKAGAQLTEYSRENLSNEWLWIDLVIKAKLQEFQEVYAAHRPLVGAEPNTDRVLPNRQTPEYKGRRQVRAATTGSTVGLLLEGDSQFRQSQKLHYSSLVAAVLSAQAAGQRPDVTDIAQLYEALGQGLTTTELEKIRAKDDITARVYARLERLALEAQKLNPALGRVESLSVIANVAIEDVDIDPVGNVEGNGKTITLAQFLLKQSVAQDRREKDVIWDVSPELQAKHSRLLAMTKPPTQGVKGSKPVNAQRAFVEIVGAQQLITLLGDEANIFGPHLTVEQFVRHYVSLSETDRRDVDNKLKGEAAYLGRKQASNIPYGLDELVGDQISAYRAVVDSVIAVGHNRITIDPEKVHTATTERHLHGELADKSYSTGEAFRDAHAQARSLMAQMLGISGRKDGEIPVEVVQRLLETNPELARQVFDLIPNASADAVLNPRADGGANVSRWVLEMFTVKDSRQAEMIYWRNLLMAEWNALGRFESNREENELEGQKLREFSRLRRRMHRVMFRLAALPDNGLRLEKFMSQLYSATDLESFMRWVNTAPDIRGEQAPLVPWVDDTAEFDPDKAGGGWTTNLAGAELREAISGLQRTTSALLGDLALEQTSINADVSVIGAIKRVLRAEAGDKTVKLDSGDRDLYERFVKSISEAGELGVGMGPQAMLYQSVSAAMGFYPQAHTKGKNPPHIALAGQFESGRDAFDYVTNYERVMAAMTAVNLDAVSNNLSQVAKDTVRTMDDQGRPVVHEMPREADGTPTRAAVEAMLTLFETAETRGLARGVLFPQVMERDFDGVLRPKLLVDRSLKALLDGTSHNDLFGKFGTLSQDTALRYVSMVETTARQFEGKNHFSVQRALNDIVIARTSAADHVLSYEEIWDLAVKSYYEAAKILQASGALAADFKAPLADPLANLLTKVKAAQKNAAAARRVGVKASDLDMGVNVVDRMALEREREATEEKTALLQSLDGNTDPVVEAQVQARIALIDEETARFRERVDLLLDDNLIGRVQTQYGYTAAMLEAEKEDAKQQLVGYITNRWHIFELGTSSLITLSKLATQVQDSGRQGMMPDLTDAEWTELSNLVIGVRFDEIVSNGSTSIAPFPDADKADDQRYYDASFAYLVEPMLDSSSPLVQAARKIHLLAGRLGETPLTDTQFVDLLGATIFADFSLGAWTSDIPRMSISANERLDSSASEPAVGMAGNSPKRQGVISAATRRTFEVPLDEHYSSTRLTWQQLNLPIFDEIDIAFPSGVERRPLAQLNNRFARAVTLAYTDAEGAVQEIDLLAADRNLGRPYARNAEAAATGLQEIHTERLRDAIETQSVAMKLPAAAFTVTVEFVHPDSQPSEPEWSNNLFFEGTSFRYDADIYESLNASLYFAEGGLNPVAQAAALDASKLGKPALEVVPVPEFADVRMIEDEWMVDFSKMLREKTRIMLTSELGFGKLEPEYYNATYKNLKLRHFVRGEQDGVPTLWSAEQVIAFQRANPSTPLPLEGADLYIPTDDVLRSMLGEQGTQGVPRLFDDQLEVDLAKVPTYRGVSETMVSRFVQGVVGETATLAETRVMNRARQQTLSVSARVSEVERTAYDIRMRRLEVEKDEVYGERAAWSGRTGEGGFNPRGALARALQRSDTMFRAENLSFDWNGVGIPFIGPRKISDINLSRMLLHELEAALAADGGFRMGWVYREGSEARAPEGLLSQNSLNPKQKALRVVRGDVVVIELDSFNGDTMLAQKRIQHFVDQGATIVLGSNDGRNDGRAPAAEFLESLNYEKVAGSVHVYRPLDQTTRYQNVRARTSTLTETRGVSRRSMMTLLAVEGQQLEENSAWVDFDNERLGAVAVTMNLVPASFLGGYNVPVEQIDDDPQVEAVRQHLRGLDNAEGRKHLRDMANAKLEGAARVKADLEFDQSFTDLLRRFDDGPGVLPSAGQKFGTGDLIPLVSTSGHQTRVLLYRHGMRAPQLEDVVKMMAEPLPGKIDGANVAVFPTIDEPAATTHRGDVIRWRPRAGYGLQVELEIPLQVLGAKKVLEWNGMKYLLVQRPKNVVLPDHGIYEGQQVDMIVAAPDTMSKESWEGLVRGHRNAFAYFGIDFTDDVATFFGVDRREAVEILNAFAARKDRVSAEAVDELLNAPRLARTFADDLTGVLDGFGVAEGWVDRLDDASAVENQVTRAIITYLSMNGAEVAHVLKSGGFNDDSATVDSQSILMPRIFTQVFDNAPMGGTLRTEINRRLNQQIFNPNTDGTGYSLNQHLQLEIRNKDPKKNLVGWLQFAEVHDSADNPVKNAMAFDEYGSQKVSQHSNAIMYQALGAESSLGRKGLLSSRLFASGKGVHRFSQEDLVDGGAWRMLTGIDTASLSNLRMSMPAEVARRGLARDAVTQFRQPLKTADVDGWSTTQRNEYDQLAVRIVQNLGLQASQKVLVDYWVRQHLGRPEGVTEDGDPVPQPSGKAVIQTAEDIAWAVEHGYLPTISGSVPLMHVQDLQLIYRSNKSKKVFRLRESLDKQSGHAETWDDWVSVSLGSALTSDDLFDSLYLLAADGFMHTYQNATRDMLDLPVSLDVLVSEQLRDPETNRLLVSLDPNQDLLASQVVALDVTRASLEEMLGGRRIAGRLQSKTAPAAEITKQRARIRKWRLENDVPVPVEMSMRDLRKNGQDLRHKATTTNAAARSLINLRIGTAMINPALYVSMGPEQWIRGTLDRAANLMTGQGTVGATAGVMAKVGASRYTPEQLTKLQRLYQTLGARNDFKAMVYHDLFYLRPHEQGMGRIERVLEGYAKFGSRMQDPTYGMRANTLARRYLEAAIMHIEATPTLQTLTVDQLIAELGTNPQFLKNNFPDAHKAATNAIAQLRSLKETVLSQTIRGIYEPLSESPNAAVNFFGNVVLKMPLLFSGYAMNVMTTITGLQGLDQMVATFMQGRTNGFKHPRTLLGRVQAKLAGREISIDDEVNFDMSSVIEGIDLSRAFIRGGLTHTALFSFGMMAGGLGLSGEDEETRKRRKLAQLQGAGFVYDPRRIENDFRNADAIFLDWLPFGFDTYFAVTDADAEGGQRSMAQLHWMLKQFVSPMMGFERFYETGDFRNVTWGFQDAIGAFPLINSLMWDDAVSTANEFAAMAEHQQGLGGPSNLAAASALLTNGVGVYERMLFESSFVNAIYVGKDRYDRDPYVLPLRDSDGTIQRDIENQARAQNISVEQYIEENRDKLSREVAGGAWSGELYLDPETGTLKEGYMSRSTTDGTLHALTENRMTMALVMQLFSGLQGGDADYWRYNMPIKTREMELNQADQAQTEALVRAAVMGQGGMPNVTAEEAATIIKQQYRDAGVWYDVEVVDKMAARAAAGSGPAALSVIDERGVEVLTEFGAAAVFQGLAKGSVQLDDASLAGIHVSFDMRSKIQTEWIAELIQEGINLGLDQSKATSRMKRLWYGPLEDPSVQGIGDILWSKDISYDEKVTYNQLNTTYVIGPDGRPWATGFTRDGLFGALGLKPVKRAYVSEQSATGTDDRLNTTDLVNGLNTGLRGLELVNESRYVPTDVEIGKAIEDAIKEAAQQSYTPFAPFASTGSGGGYGGYGGYGGGGGGGGYYSSGGSSYFTRMYALPGGTSPYGNNIPFINTSNPLIRRGDVRRERVWSERGRLKQWQ